MPTAVLTEKGTANLMETVDRELLSRLSALRTALVSDCLDRVGLRSNAMASRVRPLSVGTRLAGRARTVQIIPVDHVPEDRELWYRGEMQAVDALRPGDVLVVSTLSDGPFFGELLATAARARGATGVVIDAASRDTGQIRELGFPVFVASVNPLDSLGRLDVVAVDVPIECGGVRVEPGDVVIGDDDGVAVIPAARAEEVVALAEAKAADEDVVREALAQGRSVSETFQAYGVL
jgi:regulator of RNase E activity RraA